MGPHAYTRQIISIYYIILLYLQGKQGGLNGLMASSLLAQAFDFFFISE